MVQFLHHNTTQTNGFKILQNKERKTTQEKGETVIKATREALVMNSTSAHMTHFSTNTVKSKGPLYNRARAVGKYLSTGVWSVRGVCKGYFTNT